MVKAEIEMAGAIEVLVVSVPEISVVEVLRVGPGVTVVKRLLRVLILKEVTSAITFFVLVGLVMAKVAIFLMGLSEFSIAIFASMSSCTDLRTVPYFSDVNVLVGVPKNSKMYVNT